jgi:hypothetical protein
MKTGKSLKEFAEVLVHQAHAKRDFIVDSRALAVIPQESGQYGLSFAIENDTNSIHHINDVAHEQIANYLRETTQMNKPYYDHMRFHTPELFCSTIQTWFQRQPIKRMIRMLNAEVRAFLSDRYRPLDNYDLAEAVLPVLMETPEVSVLSCEVTDRKLYLKAVNEQVQEEVAVGDIVQAGIVITNSEVGCGALSVEPLLYRLVCSNGMIVPTQGMRKYHTGNRLGGGEVSYEYLRDDTRRATDRAVWMQVQDLVKAALQEATFKQIVNTMREAANDPLPYDIEKVVEVTAKRIDLLEEERKSVLRYLITGGDLSRWGLANAVTSVANDTASYDRATELEKAGYAVIELPRSEWEQIAA